METLHIHYSVHETECCKVSRDLWVIARRGLTLDRIPLHFLLLCPRPFPLPLSVHPNWQTGTAEGTRGWIAAVAWSDARWWVYCVYAGTDWRTGWALLCHCRAWPGGSHDWRGGSSPCLTALWGLLRDLRGKQREECGSRKEGGGGLLTCR